MRQVPRGGTVQGAAFLKIAFSRFDILLYIGKTKLNNIQKVHWRFQDFLVRGMK